MAITGHFVNNEWVSRSKILRFLYVPCLLTSEVLTNVLMDVLMKWNVDTKLSTIIVDNCTTNDSLIGKIKDKLQLNKLIHDGSHNYMRCYAHILNLVVKIRLNVIKFAIEKIREVSLIGHQPLIELRSLRRLISLVVENKRDSRYKTLPNPLEWENALVICDKLEVFYEATAIFSRPWYLTADLCFTKISEIRLKFFEWLLSPNYKVVSNMASQMIEKFDDYWGDIHELMGVAVVFYPRNKME
nr:hypothetical protein [Tanacetum cinerariifolium]